MRRFGLAVFIILMVLAVTGCGKKSGLEGKVVDGKGKPMANVKIIAKQVQPIKGYEQFEATTGSDGAFSFKKLFPTSEYILFPWFDDWSSAPQRTLKYEASKLTARFNKEGWITEDKMKVQSGPEGQTTLLTAPIVIQPSISSIEGKVIDEKGEPIANIKIVAKQKHPVPDYEQFETVTGSDGTFSFKKLFPTSEYVLFPWFDDWSSAPQRTLKYEANKFTARFNKEGWTTKDKMKVQSGPEGQTTLLTSSIVIQPCISSVEGKVVDGKGKPMAKIKIVAIQKHPVPGYEQFWAVTASDGTFRFKKLFPSSKYTLIPISEVWKTNIKRVITTTEEQETLEDKLTVRFTLANGVVTDSATGLMWAAKDNGRDIHWPAAKAYCDNYKGGGYSGWRLPTSAELEGLYKAGIRYNSGDIINISGSCPWASETSGSQAYFFSFSNGNQLKFFKSNFTFSNRALPVHSVK